MTQTDTKLIQISDTITPDMKLHNPRNDQYISTVTTFLLLNTKCTKCEMCQICLL